MKKVLGVTLVAVLLIGGVFAVTKSNLSADPGTGGLKIQVEELADPGTGGLKIQQDPGTGGL